MKTKIFNPGLYLFNFFFVTGANQTLRNAAGQGLMVCLCPSAGPEEDSGDPGPGEEAAAAEAGAWSPTCAAPPKVEH